jgi:superfamily II DNA or RNA helicase
METITKADLLKTDPALKNRPYQIEALLSIFLYAKCLVKMFCGTGKSTIITNVLIHKKKELSVVVFPSLALISQYSADYLNNDKYKKHFKKHKTMNVSSEKLENMESTTNMKEIKKFLKGKSPKIILVTYQSYQVLLDCLEGKKIGLVCYDEAHHVTSPETQKLVFGTAYFEKEVFFTATPKNENGITMFDRDEPEKNMCGPIAYDYTYLQGLIEGYLNAFEVCIDMYTENTNNSIYEAIARAILTKGTGRCLSFHSGVNGESNTNVWNFIKADAFKTAFEKVVTSEFPEKAGYYKKITLKGMDGNTPAAERKRMLSDLDETPDDEIYLIGSCETIGEGVDTKKANMCIFADPKSSITKIIQNIGRVVRPNAACPLSTILIPCWVNMENYAEAQGDRAKQNELIRQQMRSEKGDYASILNVLGALKQEDPELYEMCLSYDSNVAVEDDSEEDSEDDYDDDSESVSEADSEIDSEERRPNNRPRVKMSIHQNDAIQMLWGVKGELDFSKKFCSVVIDCEVSYGEERWRSTLKQACAYMDEQKMLPSQHSKNAAIKKLGQWVCHQKKNYAKNAQIMKKPVFKAEWEATLEKYSEYLIFNRDERWRLTLKEACAYMDEQKKSPSSADKNADIKVLGNWICKQKKSYAENKFIMKSNPVIRGEWEATLEKYNEYLILDGDEQWRSSLKQSCAYMDEHKKMPTQYSKNAAIKKLNSWISNQKMNYAKNDCIMKKPVIRAEWEATLEKYGEYLIFDNDEQWRSTLKQVCVYMDEQKKSPSSKDKKLSIQILSRWVSNQKMNYAKNECIMKKPVICAEWEATLEKYGEYLADNDEQWRYTLKQVCAYIDEQKKSPSSTDKNATIKKLGAWVTMQKQNYAKNEYIMKKPVIRDEWKATLEKYGEYLIFNNDDQWRSTLNQVCVYMDNHKMSPSQYSKNAEIKKLGQWVCNQKTKYAKNAQIMKKHVIRAEWEATLEKYSAYLNQAIIPLPSQPVAPLPKKRKITRKKQTAITVTAEQSTSTSATTSHHFAPISAIGLLHKTYLKMRSDTLHHKFKAEPQLWREYHATRKQNFAAYDPESIPANRIIQELEKIKTKRQKVVVDMGCGEASIAHHFLIKNDTRFTFHNYDHQSGGDALIQEVDISALPLEDASAEIAIMSLALWGTQENCIQYIKEAYRVLESGGKFYISDSTKKWSPEPITPENGGELLRTLLTENGFKIINEDIALPFCLFVCTKIY